MSKKAPRFVEFNIFTNRNRQKPFLQNDRTGSDLQNVASKFVIFTLELSYDLSKLIILAMILPRFFGTKF